MNCHGSVDIQWECNIEELGDAELLCLLLNPLGQSMPEPIAGAQLRRFGGLQAVARDGPLRLQTELDITPIQAAQLVAAIELGKRVQQRACAIRQKLATPEAVARCMTPRIGRLDHEELWLLALDGNQRVRSLRQVARGGLHGLTVAPGDILRQALREAASGMVLVHNHPSGNAQPSRCDIHMTHRLAQAAAVVGLDLVDHVIVTANGDFCSLFGAGLIRSEASWSSAFSSPSRPSVPSG
jgi:DNA repair protein RadC